MRIANTLTRINRDINMSLWIVNGHLQDLGDRTFYLVIAYL